MTRSRVMRLSLVILVLAFLAGAAQAQIGAIVSNWTVPSSSSVSSSGLHHSQALGDVTNALPFVGVTPCRIVDTRGPAGPYGAPSLPASTPRNFALLGGPCSGLPAGVSAYSLNITVDRTLGPGFISIYPQGGAAPLVSTLNYVANQTIANAAIVPAGTGGGITAVAGVSGTDLIIDINGYFPTGSSGLILNPGVHFEIAGNVDPLFATVNSRNQSNTTGAMAILGIAGGASGVVYGVKGLVETSGANGSAGVYGEDSSGPPDNPNAYLPSAIKGVTKTRNAILGISEVGSAGSALRAYRNNSASPFQTTATVLLCDVSGTAANFFGDVFISSISPFGSGNLSVAGTLSKGGGSFKIDHPLDPENKYLYHSFVESPDMKNIYDGVAVLDSRGEAAVTLPDWFETLNRDFRYQLTSIGRFNNVYIAQEVSGNQFKIAGGRPGSKISWQVTGIRQDAFANANRIQVEVEKDSETKGKYLHPEAFGKPASAGISRVIFDKSREADLVQQKLAAAPKE
jgi:hypothetical protein